MPLISVIVQTSPGRETNLSRCLSMLAQQTFRDFEILVIDDGSSWAQEVVWQYQNELPLSYHWRSNDCCLSRSRNIGAQMARGRLLVFIDSDLLLNPDALRYYQAYSQQKPEALFFGYYGNDKMRQAPSIWFPSTWVNWFDIRYYLDLQSGLTIDKKVLSAPFNFAWGGNFAVPQRIYESVGGANELFSGWGSEDIEFACRVILATHEIHYCADAWAEHQVHTDNEAFYHISHYPYHRAIKNKRIKALWQQIDQESDRFYQPQLFQHTSAQDLNRNILAHYGKYDENKFNLL